MSKLLESMANERIDLTLTFTNVTETEILDVLEQWHHGLPNWISSVGRKDGVSYELSRYDARTAKKKASKGQVEDE